ncbi:MAG: thioredoxin family protein [Anaerolineales bacterium]|nr:thioredoxin family protein [Anaerolineales bacterium]
MINVKILSYKNPQRYAVKRTIIAAQNVLCREYPGLEVSVTEVKELSEIEKITQVVILPSLVVNEKLVCVGRFPKKDEVISWLQEALQLPT